MSSLRLATIFGGSNNDSLRNLHRRNGLRGILFVCIQYVEARIVATSNVTVTSAWTKVADDTDDPVLIQCPVRASWEVAAVATEVAPEVAGHRLIGPNQAVTRDLIGAGFIYCRLLDVSSQDFAVTL
jgi:hypothetical protein